MKPLLTWDIARGPARSTSLHAEVEVPLRPPRRNVWEAAGHTGQVLMRAPDRRLPGGRGPCYP